MAIPTQVSFVPIFYEPLQALERLDGCGNGQLTLDFVVAVAKSWPAEEASTAEDALPSTG